MKKPVHKSKKNQEKLYNLIFGGVLALMVILLVALLISKAFAPEATDYVITADGHVHTADGAHVGTTDELYGSGYVVTEDGHVHAADGTHLGTYDDTFADPTAQPTAQPTAESTEEPTAEPTEEPAN